MEQRTYTVIDATGLVVGRLASNVAKRLLSGETVAIINAEHAAYSGRRLAKLAEFKKFFEIVGRGNPKHGPRHPKRPDTVLQRVVRGMLPMDKPKGKKAFQALRVYVGQPPGAEGEQPITLPGASVTKLRCRYVTLGAITKEFGWRGVEPSAH